MNDMSMFNLDPLADLDAFINQMNAEMTDLGQAEADPVDWSQFLKDPEFELASDSEKPKMKAASPASAASSPHSSESEQSRALDIVNDFGLGSLADDIGMGYDLDALPGLDFELPVPGIMHSLDDLPAYNANNASMQMQGVLPFAPGAGLDDLGGLGMMGDTEGVDVADLGLADFIAKFAPAPAQVQASASAAPAQAGNVSDALQQAYASLGWSAPVTVPAPAPAPAMPTSIQPAQLSLSASPSLVLPTPATLSLKRKESDAGSDISVPVKRPRGRPPKARADSGSVLATPLVRAGSIDSEGADEQTSAVKRTASGKPSTARPKSVVPEKYFKDGTAQALTGMTMEQILAFPTFEELLKQVAPHLREAAAEFGERIAENRDKAKDAAKKSREERKAKIETLEQTVEGLENKIKGMQGVLMALVAKGVLGAADVQAFM